MNTHKLARFIIMLAVPALMSLSLSAQNYTVPETKVKLTAFKVTLNEENVSINWTTDNKAAANYFEVQRSTDGSNFKTIALVLGADPTILTGDSYGYVDKDQKNRKHLYYRVKHIDSEGEIEISETRLLAKL